MLREPVILPGDELVGLAEVARVLKVAPMTARVWVRSGKIPAKEAGSRRIVVRRVDLDAFHAARPKRALVSVNG